MFAIMNVPAVYTLQPLAYMDKVIYALCVEGNQVLTFATKEIAVQMAQLMFGE